MGKEISIKIDSAMHGHRIEYVLKKELKISSSLIKRMKRAENGILLNGVRTTVVTKVSDGDILTVNIKGKETENVIPVNIPIDVLWEDEDILIVNKPGTMSVHPSGAHKTDTLANAVMYYMGSCEAIHIITRLDRETSGVLLIAKNPRVAALLSEDIKAGKVKKEYIAIVNGAPDPSMGTLSAPIKKKEGRGSARCVSKDGKEAVTLYELIKKTDTLSLMKLIPITGRTHQLRVHMSHIGHPIYGDCIYGAPQMGERVRLHCQRITFLHPITGKEVSITAEVPEDFNGLFK
ncbi:MAG: RluA family pseudouridine synthase [Clostridia bacterium]|nr:RluA family pseudouridine synthase [Clostridia bacterium]